jgi:anaerobic selenocysteine-containing dehydrogenase
LGEEFLDDYFFAKLGASRIAKTLCAVPTTEVAKGMYGKMPGVAFEDYVHSKFILIWGANPKSSNIHLVPFLRRAKKDGTFIAVVDPRRNFSFDEIDLHLPVYPGADLPLALGMINYWHKNDQLDLDFLNKNGKNLAGLIDASKKWTIDKAAKASGVSLEDLKYLADMYAEVSPAVLRCGWGVERNKNGGQAVAAILAMPALLGKFGIRGGGYTMSNSGAVSLDKKAIMGDFDWNTRIINMSQLGRTLNAELEPPVKALFIYNCNPAVTAPNQNSVLQGLSREDLFTIVFEQVMTDSTKYADIILPAVTFLEQYEIKRAYGSYIIGGVKPVIEPCGEAKSNEQVFAELGKAMGWDDEYFRWDTKTCMKEVAENIHTNGSKPRFSQLMNGKNVLIQFNGESPIQFKNIFPKTPDKKINFIPEVLGPQPFKYQQVSLDSFPLALITPGNSKMISSTLGEFNYNELLVTIHPGDATERGIVNGDRVRVHNGLGEVICKVKINEEVRLGVVSMPKGAWLHSSGNTKTSTALCPDHVNVVGGGACYNDARVRIEKI